ncbi:hypothetical protein [Gibbsiella quercinecans]|uniref:hypothetical protein n=1 Tax=Gibbsiella quercinecans TaxID=929813 RepID=UPI001601ECB3|nr:hypothetical protein [Gibbsiella quercinecans]
MARITTWGNFVALKAQVVIVNNATASNALKFIVQHPQKKKPAKTGGNPNANPAPEFIALTHGIMFKYQTKIPLHHYYAPNQCIGALCRGNELR